MRHFVDDDEGYQQWLADHMSDFVINTGRSPSAAYLVLHRASCGTIRGVPARGSTFTGEYTKVCGRRDELEAFARELGGIARPCGLCLGHPVAGTRSGGRYGPLRDYLVNCHGSEVRMTFAGIESLVGRLPDSARLHRAWWSNGFNVEARAWRDAGWRVQKVDQASEHVTFQRDAPVPNRQIGYQTAGGEAPYIDPDVTADLVVRVDARRFDTGKLVHLIEELNDNYSRGNTYAAHALLRAILDHIPPLLDCGDFPAVRNSDRLSRTDKSYARKLLDFRPQANDALHRPISRKVELLCLDDMPPRIWINRLLQGCTD